MLVAVVRGRVAVGVMLRTLQSVIPAPANVTVLAKVKAKVKVKEKDRGAQTRRRPKPCEAIELPLEGLKQLALEATPGKNIFIYEEAGVTPASFF